MPRMPCLSAAMKQHDGGAPRVAIGVGGQRQTAGARQPDDFGAGAVRSRVEVPLLHPVDSLPSLIVPSGFSRSATGRAPHGGRGGSASGAPVGNNVGRWTTSLDRRVLVTGASAGIGAGLAEEFARRGAIVGICARRRDRLEEVLNRCRTYSPAAQMWITDMGDAAQVDALIASVLETLGGIDILVNNAGIPKRRHVTKLDPATVESVMNVNYFGPARLTLGLLPAMVESGRGLIINVSSVAATLSSPGEAAYDASKAALTAFSEAMAVDLWESGVKVLVVYPGLVDTELFSLPDNDPVMDTSIVRIPVAEMVAAIFAGVASEASQVYAPQWFADVAAQKAKDVGAFLAGVAAYVAQQQSGP